MNEKNILSLKARLVQLGFEASVETLLRCNICFAVPMFEIMYARQVGKDSFHFVVHLERGEKENYELKYYIATLRKQVMIPAELEALDHSMLSVDWNALVDGRSAPVGLETSSVQTAFDVLRELQDAGAAAELVKYKYWSGTTLEPMIQQLGALKNEWEITERFYFFDESAVITFDESARFLNSRWMEKQMAVRKKLLVKKTLGDVNPGSVAGGKLLGKNPRRLARRGNDKSL